MNKALRATVLLLVAVGTTLLMGCAPSSKLSREDYYRAGEEFRTAMHDTKKYEGAADTAERLESYKGKSPIIQAMVERKDGIHLLVIFDYTICDVSMSDVYDNTSGVFDALLRSSVNNGKAVRNATRARASELIGIEADALLALPSEYGGLIKKKHVYGLRVGGTSWYVHTLITMGEADPQTKTYVLDAQDQVGYEIMSGGLASLYGPPE